MILYKNGKVLIGDKIVETDIVANHGRIIEIAPEVVPDEQTEIVDCTNRFVLPALVDLCSYGAEGRNFNTADENGMKKIMEFYISHGVGTVFPTLMPDTEQNLCCQLQLIARLANDYPEIKGIHLDGPFLAEDAIDCPPQLLRKPSMDEFVRYQKAAEGKIHMITIAPELPDALPFIAEVTESRVTVSLGHSNADDETIEKAFAAGAKSVTDWGCDMPTISRKKLGLMGSALLSDCYCQAVFYLSHLSPQAMQLLLKTKNADKIIGITADRADAYTGLANIVTFCDIHLQEAIKMWTMNPARLVGLQNVIGTIEVNKHADFIIFGGEN